MTDSIPRDPNSLAKSIRVIAFSELARLKPDFDTTGLLSSGNLNAWPVMPTLDSSLRLTPANSRGVGRFVFGANAVRAFASNTHGEVLSNGDMIKVTRSPRAVACVWTCGDQDVKKMTKNRLLALLVGAILVSGGLSSGQDEKEKNQSPVVGAVHWGNSIATRYGASQWEEYLYFPGRKVRCTIPLDRKTRAWSGWVVARYGEEPALLRFGKLLDAEWPETSLPPREVEIPREVAEEIFALADLNRKLEKESARVARTLRETGVLLQAPANPAK
jgi:hypothetical protein